MSLMIRGKNLISGGHSTNFSLEKLATLVFFSREKNRLVTPGKHRFLDTYHHLGTLKHLQIQESNNISDNITILNKNIKYF